MDELKERAAVIEQMRNRERQTRSWKKISYATKKFTPMGVVFLGITQGFELYDTKVMWEDAVRCIQTVIDRPHPPLFPSLSNN